MSKPKPPAPGDIPDMTTFLASSVHDMKNSVSLLINGLQKTLGSVSPENFPGYGDLAQMTYEAKRINNNLVQLLTLYKLDQQLYPFDSRQVAVDEFFCSVADQTSGLLQSQGVVLEFEAAPDLYWYFDEDLVSGVIGNAFNNAIRYTKDRVRLSARLVDGLLELAIEDNGSGYSAEMLEQSRDALRGVNFQSGSTGLGLYFSASVAKLHKNRGRCGAIRLENGGPFGGGCFVLTLP